VSIRYEDDLNRWFRDPDLGKDLFCEHVRKALAEDLPVRLIIATPKDPSDMLTIKAGSEQIHDDQRLKPEERDGRL
jgi:hypothetical protein